MRTVHDHQHNLGGMLFSQEMAKRAQTRSRTSTGGGQWESDTAPH